MNVYFLVKIDNGAFSVLELGSNKGSICSLMSVYAKRFTDDHDIHTYEETNDNIVLGYDDGCKAQFSVVSGSTEEFFRV